MRGTSEAELAKHAEFWQTFCAAAEAASIMQTPPAPIRYSLRAAVPLPQVF